jgi:glutathione S-transferase
MASARAVAGLGDGPMRLITIPFSHYCEKARWALDRAGLDYLEEPWLPMLSWAALARVGAGRTAPALVTRDGVLADSTDILHWVDEQGEADLYPEDVADEVAAIEDDLDRHLGPATRRLAYAELLPRREALCALIERAPAAQAKIALPALPVLIEVIRRGLRIDDAGVARSQRRLDDTLDTVADRMSDGRTYLTGDRFTAADLTLASLLAPMVVPPAYAAFLPPADLMPASYRDKVEALRATPAGALTMRLYADER